MVRTQACAPQTDEGLQLCQRRLDEAAAIVNWLAHDFGNILTGVLGFTELSLNQLSPDSEAHEFTREIQQAAARGSELVHKLLLFGRRGRSQAGATTLSAWMTQETPGWQYLLGPQNRLCVDAPTTLPAAMIAPDMLRQLLEPLLQNAKQAMNAPGTVTIAARSAELDADECAGLLGRASPGKYVDLTVADTGRGFDAETRRRWLAEPFFSSTPRHHGLGLPVVYGILCTHGGGFRMEDVKPAGACIRVFLPIVRSPGPIGEKAC